jgi:hypothetical protein
MRYVDSLDDIELWELVVDDGVLRTVEGTAVVPEVQATPKFAVLDIADIQNMLLHILPAYDCLEQKASSGNFGIQVSHDNEKMVIIEFSKLVQKFGFSADEGEQLARSLLQAAKAVKALRPRILVPQFNKKGS